MNRGRWAKVVVLVGALMVQAGCASKPAVVVDPALAAARQRLVKNPGEPAPQLELAELYLKRHDYLRASQYLNLVEEQAPARQRAAGIGEERLFHLGVLIAVGSQHYSQAIRRCQARLEQVIGDAATRRLLASLLEGVGDEAGAERQWRLLVALQPAEAQHLLELGRFYLRTDRVDRSQLAQRQFARYLELAPDGPEASRVKTALRIQQLDEQIAAE